MKPSGRNGAPEIRRAGEEADLRAIWPVMAQLRPGLSLAAFVEQARRQEGQGYRLASIAVDGRVVGVAGYRLGECLAWGRFLYVDDLVTDEAERSRGHGRALLAWLVDEARREGCRELHLDSGVQRYAAHRFYLRNGMDITSHHFRVVLAGGGRASEGESEP